MRLFRWKLRVAELIFWSPLFLDDFIQVVFEACLETPATSQPSPDQLPDKQKPDMNYHNPDKRAITTQKDMTDRGQLKIFNLEKIATIRYGMTDKAAELNT